MSNDNMSERERAFFPKMAEQHDREAAAGEILGDIELGHAFELIDVVKQFAERPPSAEQQNEWGRQVVDALRAEFGDQAAQALEDASALVKRGDGRVLKMIETLGLGNHPQVVVRLAKAARRGRK